MRRVIGTFFAVLVLALAGFAAWLFFLPQERSTVAPEIAATETRATLEALKPPKRERPVIAVIGLNDSTETTDYLMPYGILRRADVAEVMLLATESGPVSLYPALKVEPQATIAKFDEMFPDGADYVIVPAMSRDDDPAVLRWIRDQAAKGAIIIGVCAGAKVVAATGLLDGRRATTHWYALKDMLEAHPEIQYIRDRRIVVDGRIATTTGVSASIPMALTLIEAIAGRAQAEEVARSVGVARWDARHASGAFTFTRPFALAALFNRLAFWRYEKLGLRIENGVDEISLALVADAWSRTFRSRAVTFASGGAPVLSRNGVRVLADEVASDWPEERLLPPLGDAPPQLSLDNALGQIAARYGASTMRFVAQQLEYPLKERSAASFTRER